jgi:hypothetical protein
MRDAVFVLPGVGDGLARRTPIHGLGELCWSFVACRRISGAFSAKHEAGGFASVHTVSAIRTQIVPIHIVIAAIRRARIAARPVNKLVEEHVGRRVAAPVEQKGEKSQMVRSIVGSSGASARGSGRLRLAIDVKVVVFQGVLHRLAEDRITYARIWRVVKDLCESFVQRVSYLLLVETVRCRPALSLLANISGST